MEPTHTPDLLTISEASRVLAISVDTLRRWSDSGQIHTITLPSGHRRYRREDILAVLEQRGAAS